MSDTEPNGLASLAAQRERARRSMPASRHPVTRGDQTVENANTPDPIAHIEPPEISLVAKPPQPRIAPTELGPTFKVTLYVDRDTDEFMQAARIEGMTSQPKVDVSRSAVVRLALRRLMDDMSPSEVKMLLANQVVRSTGPGRRRR